MLSFTRKHFVVVLVLFCCAVFALAEFGPLDKTIGRSTELVPLIATNPPTLAGTPCAITVSLPNIIATPGPVTIPITVGLTTGLGIISYDLNIDFNPAIILPASPAADSVGTLSSSMSITPNTNNPGHLIISAFQGASLSGSGTLINLKFNVIGSPGQSTPLTFADFTDPSNGFHPGFVFNEGDPVVCTMNGSVTIPGGSTPTNTATATATSTVANTPTFTPTNSATSTATNTPTFTPTPPPNELIYGMTAGTTSGVAGINLVKFNSTSPGNVTVIGPFTGLVAGHAVRSIDFRPATGQLYALSTNNAAAQLYTVNLNTAVLTPVGSGFSIGPGTTTNVEIDFNPVVDRIRIVTASTVALGFANNFRANPDTGALVATDTNLAFAAGDPQSGSTNNQVSAAAYSNNFAGATSTTLYAWNYQNDSLVTIGSVGGTPASPNTGQMFTVNIPPSFLTLNPGIGMDISGATGTLWVAHDNGSGTSMDFFAKNPSNGAETFVGIFPASSLVTDLSVFIPAVATPTATSTATFTPTPTNTATATNTATFTPTPTNTATAAATPTAPQYQIFDIGVVQAGDTASQGEGVSNGGIALGRSLRTGGGQAFTYSGGGGIVALPNLAARTYCVSNAATDNGTVIGTCSTTFFGTSRLPTIWQNGVVSQLPLPAGQTLGDAYDLNSSGIAVGSVDAGISQRGAIYNGATGSVITATTSNGSFFTTAFGINDSGRVAGIGVDPNNAARNVPMVWDVGAGSAIDIGALPGFNGGIPFAIGNGGHVVGASMLNQGSGLPFIWTPGGGMVAIPLAAGTSQGSARGVNTAGWAVGTDSSAFAIPFLYNGTATYRLQDLIPAGTGWDLSTNTSSAAMGISDNNIIVGTGVLNGNVHAFSMVPAGAASPTPSATFTPTITATTIPTATSTSTATFTTTPSPSPSSTPSIQFSSPTYTEDESQVAAITITRLFNTTILNSVTFSTSDGTAIGGAACTAGVDYISVVGQTITFNPGDTSRTVNITICGDNITEPDQTVNLSLSGAVVGTPSAAILTINDTASTYKNAANIAINGGTTSAPYPSTITVAGGPPVIGSMRITLYDYASSFPDDTDFLLIGPQGQNIILLAGAGGHTPGGPVTLNFSDTSGSVVPQSGPLVRGAFEPTSYVSVTNFPAPAPAGPYHEPGGTVGGTGTQTLFGNFGGTNPNGSWNLYVRNRTLIPNAQLAVIGNIAGGWGIEFLSSTAAGASISGRVMTTDGAGIRNAKVVITGNSLSEPLMMTTGSFGYFTFDGLQTGETYVVTVNSQRYTFSTPSRVVSLVDNITDADFVASPLE